MVHLSSSDEGSNAIVFYVTISPYSLSFCSLSLLLMLY